MAFAHAKIILLGEHSVVYGYPAIAAAIERGVSAQATLAQANQLIIQPTPSEHDLRRVRDALSALRATYSSAWTPLTIEAKVNFPIAAGLGSSAALGVAMIMAINDALDHHEEKRAVIERALTWERLFHDSPSGIDCAVATEGTMLHFCKSKEGKLDYQSIKSATPLHLVVAHSGPGQTTSTMVANVRAHKGSHPTQVEEIFEGIALLVERARAALKNGDLSLLGSLLTENQNKLSALGVSTPRLNELCELALGAGALGAKLTGGGGGGCMFALAETKNQALEIALALEERASLVFTTTCSA